jgi:hypothetical protein
MFLRLCLAMSRTQTELSATLGADEFAELCAFFELEPWGAEREDGRAAMIAAAAAASATGTYDPAQYHWGRLYERAMAQALMDEEAEQESHRRAFAHLAAVLSRKGHSPQRPQRTRREDQDHGKD